MSYSRFETRIIKSWKKRGFMYNSSHVHILKYSYQTLMFWSILRSKKISEKNKPVGHPTLF